MSTPPQTPPFSLRTHKVRMESGLGGRMADLIAAGVGSWRFILIQTLLLCIWIVLNLVAWMQRWDPYPFVLLNLVLSFQAAFTAPIIMMAQNRQSDIDRQRAELDYQINLKAELDIESLHAKIDMMRQEDISRLIALLEKVSDARAPTEQTTDSQAKP